jgi:CRP-like cAMP-binding protein
MSTTAEIREQMRDKVLFREFTDLEMDEFIDLLDLREAAAGETIVRQDELGECMYIVVRGRARVVHHQNDQFVELATLKDGDFFGELSLVDRGPRSADVLALEPTTLLRIDLGAVSALAGVYPAAAFKFLVAIGRILVDRLRRTNQRYIDSLLFPLAGKD